jgi:hypothetical protein
MHICILWARKGYKLSWKRIKSSGRRAATVFFARLVDFNSLAYACGLGLRIELCPLDS